MKRLILIALLLAAAMPVAARDSFQGELAAHGAQVPPQVPITHPSLYSFADVYRLTVIGQPPVLPLQAVESPMRVAASQLAGSSDLQFSIRSVREPQVWALLIAGLLLAGWVARRRMETLL